MGLREEKKAELRGQIRNTALGLFGERGISGTRVADIVALLRISQATFFNYFPSKQAICEEAVTDLITRAVAKSLADDRRPVAEQLSALAAELIAELTADRPLILLLRRQPELISAGWLRIGGPELVLARRIGEAQVRGELRSDLPTEVLSEAYLATVLMTISRGLRAEASQSELATTLRQALSVWAEGSTPRRSRRGSKPRSV